jgi:oxygen-dependent protoporphyrinogen oxidase
MRMDRLIRSGLTTRLLSWPAKLRVARLAFDLARAVRADQLDYSDMRKSAPLDTESAGGYARRALGDEVDNYLCSPITRTMLIADTQKVSKVELFSGIANIFASQISALRGGQGRLPLTLAEKLDVHLNTPVTHVTDLGDGVEVTVGSGPDGVVRKFDACVITAPLPVAAAMCPDRAMLLAPLNGRLGYTRGLTVALGFPRRPDTRAMLVQMPTCEDADVALMFVDHNKAVDRAPADKALIGTCWETDAAATWMDRPDDEIVAHTHASVRRVFGDLGEVEFSHVTRWERALPLTGVGAYRLIGEFNAAVDPGDRIQFAGDYLSAAGQHTAIEFGSRAAANLVASVH